MPGRKIAICGSSHLLTERDEIASLKGWEKWSMNNLFYRFEDLGWTRWFELHDFTRKGNAYIRRGQTEYSGYRSINNYLKAIDALDIPVFMQKRLALIKKAEIFPFNKIIRKLGTKYFGCSFAWMIGFAIYEHLQGKTVSKIRLYSIDFPVYEYYFQRPTTEYFIGLARGLGIKVELSAYTTVLQAPWIYAYREDYRVVDALYVSIVKHLATMAAIPMQNFFEGLYHGTSKV